MKIVCAALVAVMAVVGLSGCQTATDAMHVAPVKKTYAVKVKETNPYKKMVTKYAKEYGVPTRLAHAVVQVESRYNPRARGAAGEVGLMQIKPATARMMGFRGSSKNLYHPETNIKYGMKYLAKAHQLGGGTVCGTILKYNAGHGAKRMNRISSRYCTKIKHLL